MALFLGLVHQLSRQETAPEQRLSFAEARSNFYHAAKEGLQARIRWIDGQEGTLQALLLNKLIPLAVRGLQAMGIDQYDSHYYLQEIISHRVKSMQNGASWQRKFIVEHGKDFQAMTMAYLERQQDGQPVHQWTL